MATYMFSVVVQGEDVQEASANLREEMIQRVQELKEEFPADALKVHVTDSVRVSN